MTSIAQPAPIPVSSGDRFSLTVFFALAMHAIIILGVSFNLVDESDPDSLSTMEITLVHNRAEEEPEDAGALQKMFKDEEEDLKKKSPSLTKMAMNALF